MADYDPIQISPRLAVPRDELELRATRSSGPGGQHVNTSSTRVELVWDVASSPSLDDVTRERLLTRLATRLDTTGKLRLVAQAERSQFRNREAVIERFAQVVAAALVERKARKATRPTKASKRKRLDEKKKRGVLKETRKKPGRDE